MKLTESQLRKIILEEMQSLTELGLPVMQRATDFEKSDFSSSIKKIAIVYLTSVGDVALDVIAEKEGMNVDSLKNDIVSRITAAFQGVLADIDRDLTDKYNQ